MEIKGTIEFGYEREVFEMNNHYDDPKDDPRPDPEDDTVDPGKVEEEEGEIKTT